MKIYVCISSWYWDRWDSIRSCFHFIIIAGMPTNWNGWKSFPTETIKITSQIFQYLHAIHPLLCVSVRLRARKILIFFLYANLSHLRRCEECCRCLCLSLSFSTSTWYFFPRLNCVSRCSDFRKSFFVEREQNVASDLLFYALLSHPANEQNMKEEKKKKWKWEWLTH